MALSDFDRSLLARCLSRQPKAWEDFVDRFTGLILHVIDHSARSRSMPLSAQDREDLVSEVLLTLVKDDFAVLRHFRGQSSLATYLAVIARRIVVYQLLQRKSPPPVAPRAAVSSQAVPTHMGNGASASSAAVQRVIDRDEVNRLLRDLTGPEAQIVRMYHLEGKSYQEISATLGISENSIGPTLSRARERMRSIAANTAQ